MAGTGAGRCYRNLKEHPGTGTQILKYSIVAGRHFVLCDIKRGHFVLYFFTVNTFWGN